MVFFRQFYSKFAHNIIDVSKVLMGKLEKDFRQLAVNKIFYLNGHDDFYFIEVLLHSLGK